MVILIADKLHVLPACSSGSCRSLAHVDHLLLLLLPLLLLLHALDRFPGDAVAHGFTAAAEDWEGVQPRIVSENLLQIVRAIYIVNALERLPLLFQVFDRGLIFSC